MNVREATLREVTSRTIELAANSTSFDTFQTHFPFLHADQSGRDLLFDAYAAMLGQLKSHLDDEFEKILEDPQFENFLPKLHEIDEIEVEKASHAMGGRKRSAAEDHSISPVALLRAVDADCALSEISELKTLEETLQQENEKMEAEIADLRKQVREAVGQMEKASALIRNEQAENIVSELKNVLTVVEKQTVPTN